MSVHSNLNLLTPKGKCKDILTLEQWLAFTMEFTVPNVCHKSSAGYQGIFAHLVQ